MSIFVNKHKFLEKKLKNSPNSVEIKRINLCTLSLRVDIAGWLSSQVGADCLANYAYTAWDHLSV